MTPDTEAAIARINTAHQRLMDRLDQVVAADYDAARVEDQDRDEARAAQWRAEYTAYVCSMSDHGCACLALGFDQWAAVTHP